ncbi:hypothetical protein ES703_54999 [subsurface metagenome]
MPDAAFNRLILKPQIAKIFPIRVIMIVRRPQPRLTRKATTAVLTPAAIRRHVFRVEIEAIGAPLGQFEHAGSEVVEIGRVQAHVVAAAGWQGCTVFVDTDPVGVLSSHVLIFHMAVILDNPQVVCVCTVNHLLGNIFAVCPRVDSADARWPPRPFIPRLTVAGINLRGQLGKVTFGLPEHRLSSPSP